jgi:hypothetical protein
MKTNKKPEWFRSKYRPHMSMLTPVICSGTLRVSVFVLVCLGALALGCWLRAIYDPEWQQRDASQKTSTPHPYMVEADCYSQLARVQRILHGEGLIQNHFKVENWPEGLIPSTTAPFDYAILLLYAPLTLFTQYPLDWAGALISPALWISLVLFWIFFRSRQFNWVGRALLVIGSAALPAFIWATACGRPRHQSLILFFLALGLTAEYERWQIGLSPKRLWNIFAGVVWGLACWTSFFEPTLIVALLIAFNLVVRRRENRAFLVSFGIVMLIALLVEGVHIFIPSPQYHEALRRWLETIAEVRGFDFATMVWHMTFVLLILPVVAWRLLKQPGDRRTDLFLILLTALLTLITLFQSRWIYYASLGELLLVARYCQMMPVRWPRVVVVAIFFIGLADADHQIWVTVTAGPAANQPSPQLERIAHSIDKPGGIMAPWWLSPGLLYFSGQPIVTGSSHCGISGIVAGAKFYAATSWVDAERILQERRVRWVVVYDDQTDYNGMQYVYPLLNSSRQILGLPAYSDAPEDKYEADRTVIQTLITDRFVPTSMRLRAVTQQFKLYEYLPAGE